MSQIDKTVHLASAREEKKAPLELLVTVFDGKKPLQTINLNQQHKDTLCFGRAPQNDIVLESVVASREHGRLRYDNGHWVIEDRGVYTDSSSTNGLIFNQATISSRSLAEGDFIRIDDGVETVSEGVLFLFSFAGSENQWHTLPLQKKRELTIGRSEACNIVLPHVSVSKYHARIIPESDGYYILDNESTNGVLVNNCRISGKVKLHEKDIIDIAAAKLIFTETAVSYYCYKNGVSVDASDIVIRRGKGVRSFVTCNHISLNIKPSELVAIVGGSGAGKSTILNSMCGYLKPAQGELFINGIDLYRNFDSLKNIIGYVPQADIVYDNLTLHDMLMYTAKLRLPKDTSPEERETAIARAIATVELQEKRQSFIRNLSGGQRKRASIAVELLSDPNLLFLDEPASGLDPGTERNLMQSLRNMANNGKTVILVTHSTLQLAMCDRVVFMGRGGNLCFYGALREALAFFGVSDVVDIYNMIGEEAEVWSKKYQQESQCPAKPRKLSPTVGKAKKHRLSQLGVLCARYWKLIVNDRQRLLLLLAQAPLLAVLISFVADGSQFEQYEMTKSLLFALSCSAFWVGMLNSIQEVCKERSIMKREYMAGLSLSSYVLSKSVVLGILCLIQSILISVVFYLLVGMPEQGMITAPFLEILITTFLTAVSSAAMGLFVSSLFTNADRAMTVAPILLMPQILFSGLIFALSGATEMISWFAICRWSMEGYGTTANLNTLPLKLQQEGLPLVHEAEDYFEFTVSHLLTNWGTLVIFTLTSLLLARIVLSKISKEQS